jgi:hypothetical protein
MSTTSIERHAGTKRLKSISAPPAAPERLRGRLGAALSTALAAALGIAPHVLHHAGPLAGAALLAGTSGSLLFGAIGLIAAIPLLVRAHHRCGSWRTPAALLALMTATFAISAFVIGPAITTTGETNPSGKPALPHTSPGALKESHDAHH